MRGFLAFGVSASCVARTSPCLYKSGSLPRKCSRLSLLDALTAAESLTEARADCASRIVCSKDIGSSSIRLLRNFSFVSSLTSSRARRRSAGVAGFRYHFLTVEPFLLLSSNWNEGWKWFTYRRIAPYTCARV